jgi:hypothetical protein
MNALRPVTATLLAFWLGFLACVLGCAQPVLASTPSGPQISEASAIATQADSDKMGDAGPCCHHHQGTSDKNKQGLQTISCCPLDATLIQKQDPASSKSGHPYAVVLILFVLNPSLRLSACHRINALTVCHAGRDVLLQAHVLRI